MYKRVSRLLHILLLVIWLGTCGSSIYIINREPGTPTIVNGGQVTEPSNAAICITGLDCVSTPVAPPTTIASTSILNILSTSGSVLDVNWTLLQPGLERREIPVYNDQNQLVETVYIWRLDQRYFRLDVAYEERPKSLEAWQSQTHALMVVNGGYYSIDNEMYFPDGLTIVNGKASGRSFGNGGMLAINNSLADLRWLAQEPYNSYEPLEAALQSFPILVQPGGVLGYGPEKESHASARRTVIGQDREGRILFIVAPQGHFTLHQLSVYLTRSDLNLEIAINLDGGGSTGILVASPHELIPTTRPIPFVILVYPR